MLLLCDFYIFNNVVVVGGRVREILEEGVTGEWWICEVLLNGEREDAGEVGRQGDSSPLAEGQGIAGQGHARERNT